MFWFLFPQDIVTATSVFQLYARVLISVHPWVMWNATDEKSEKLSHIVRGLFSAWMYTCLRD